MFADAAQDNAQQIADVENFIQQGVDLLLISPNEAAPLTDVVAKAYDGGIPVIVLDRKVPGDKYTMWIGADNVLIGEKAGEFVANWCAEQGHSACNVIELRGLEGATPAQERGDGFRTGIASNPDVTIIASQNADWLREKAIPVSQAMFQANPEVHVVYAHNDPMGEAAIISAENANLDLSTMAFVGIDALPTADGGIRSVMDGKLTVTYVYPTGGAQAIDYALQILEGGEAPPKTVVLETEEISADNAAEMYTQYGGQQMKVGGWAGLIMLRPLPSGNGTKYGGVSLSAAGILSPQPNSNSSPSRRGESSWQVTLRISKQNHWKIPTSARYFLPLPTASSW